jgi:hypothetical protein
MKQEDVDRVLLEPAYAGKLRCINAAYSVRQRCDPSKPNKPNCWCVRIVARREL